MIWMTLSLDTLKILESCESFDFFEFMLSLLDTLLLLLDENFDDLTPWTASLAKNAPFSWRNTLECQHQTNRHLYFFHYPPTTNCILDEHLTTSWRGHWIASSPLPQRLWSYWKTVSPQWCYTFWSICHWSSFSSLWGSLSFMPNPSQWCF